MQAETKLELFFLDPQPERDESFIKVLPLGEERGGERSVRVGLVCFNFTWKLYYLVYNIQNHWRMGALNLV